MLFTNVVSNGQSDDGKKAEIDTDVQLNNASINLNT